jgi:hypothetical protein
MKTFKVHYYPKYNNIMELVALKDQALILDTNGNIYLISIRSGNITFDKVKGQYKDIAGGYSSKFLALTIEGEYKKI